jgi:hypothetical protein
MDTSASPKKHQFSRYEARWLVCLLTSQTKIIGETENISSEGALVSCPELPPPENDFPMLIKPPNRNPLNVTGKVVWTTVFCQTDGSKRLGAEVQFVSISEKDRQYLQSVVAADSEAKSRGEAEMQAISPEVPASEKPGPTRAAQIIDVRMPVFYNKGGQKVQALASRFSTRGCHLYTKLAPPSGVVFSLKMKNPRTGKSIQVDSSVIKCIRRVDKNQWGMIVRFMNLSTTDREEIREILKDATDMRRREKGMKYLKTKVGQAILGHFSRKKPIR